MPLKDPVARAAYHKAYMAKRYAEDPEFKARHTARTRKNSERYRQEKRAWLDAYLAEHPCVDCGEADPIVLEFDHVRGVKLGHVSHMVRRHGASLKVMIAEVEKCEVRCANCHRRVTHQRRVAVGAAQ